MEMQATEGLFALWSLQNYRALYSAEFLATDSSLVIATLKFHVLSRRISSSKFIVFRLESKRPGAS